MYKLFFNSDKDLKYKYDFQNYFRIIINNVFLNKNFISVFPWNDGE